MTSCHRPRIYRSTDGCCICGAKSSSSRFTSSSRYELYFERCFGLSDGEERHGDICNACVLLVKRFRKLPSGSTRCWSHVKDARSGPGLKSMTRIKSRQIVTDDYVMTTRRSKQFQYDSLHSAGVQSKQHLSYAGGNNSSMFIDFDYWTPVKTCCGYVYCGRYGDCLIDAALYQRCKSHSSHDYAVTMTTTSTAESSSIDSGNDNDDDYESVAKASPISSTSSCLIGDDIDDCVSAVSSPSNHEQQQLVSR